MGSLSDRVDGPLNTVDRIAVCSRSFSRNAELREKLLRRYERVTFNDEGEKLQGPSLIEFLRGHNKAIVALETVNESVLQALPELEVISKYGVGLDGIDLMALKRHQKRLGWTGGTNRRSVAELTLSFAIALLRHLPRANKEVLAGHWRQLSGRQLTGRTVGIIGCGNVGQDLVKILQPFECRILINDIRDYPDFYAQHRIETAALDELLSVSDVVSLHVPFNDSTRNLLSAERLALMDSEAILINTARGGLVDERALKSMLKENRLLAAAFDVFAVEPPDDRELLELPNFLVTPHIGGSSYEAILNMGLAAIEGLNDNGVITKEFLKSHAASFIEE